MTDRNQALQCIVRQACQGELIFPTNMGAALRLHHALVDPGCHLDAAAAMVLAEPLIAARLVAIANSVAYTRFGGHVSNVRTAVSLLGFQPLRALVSVIVVRQLAEQISDPALKKQADQLWQHSAYVAALAKVIAREFTDVDQESAMFAGVVHEIDGFYLLSRASELPQLLGEELDPEGYDARSRLSACILRVLKIPKEVALSVESVVTGKCHLPPQSLGDVLCLANALTPIPSPLAEWVGTQAVKPSPDENFAVGEKMLSEVLTDHAKEVGEIASALLS